VPIRDFFRKIHADLFSEHDHTRAHPAQPQQSANRPNSPNTPKETKDMGNILAQYRESAYAAPEPWSTRANVGLRRSSAPAGAPPSRFGTPHPSPTPLGHASPVRYASPVRPATPPITTSSAHPTSSYAAVPSRPPLAPHRAATPVAMHRPLGVHHHPIHPAHLTSTAGIPRPPALRPHHVTWACSHPAAPVPEPAAFPAAPEEEHLARLRRERECGCFPSTRSPTCW